MLMGFELFMDVLRPTNAIKHRRKTFNTNFVVKRRWMEENEAKGKQLKNDKSA